MIAEVAPATRLDAREDDHLALLTERASFVDDIERPGELSAAIVRSPVAHARLLGIDVSRALRCPGVRAVLTAADLDTVPRIPIRSFPRPGLEEHRQPVLAVDRVRYVGEPVALVVADDPFLAEDAAETVSLELDRLPPVLGVADEASATMWDGLGNRLCSWEAADGDVEAAFERAALVVEETFRTPRRTAVPIETRGLVAEWSDGGETLQMWGPTKFLSFTQRSLAAWFGLELDRVLCHRVDVGGMFGVRGELYPEDFLIPWAAHVVGRPVKWIEDRREHLLAINHSPELRLDLALALDADGGFLAMRARALVDLGAYTRPLGGRIPLLVIEELPGPYRWPALGIASEGWATTKVPVGTVRAPLALEATFARERAIDMAANRLGMDPLELRRRNLITPVELPFTRRYGREIHDQHYDSGDYPAMLEKLLAEAGHARLIAERDARRAQGEMAGVGVGLFLAHSGLGEEETVGATLIDGELVVRSAAAEIGQGLERAMRLVAAEVWRDAVPVRVVTGTTIATPPSRGTFASRSVVFVGNAVRDACKRLLDAAREEAARRLGSEPRGLSQHAGGFGDAHGNTVSWAELGPLSAEGAHRDSEVVFGFGGHLALVTADPATGTVRVERLAVGYDCGRAIDPAGVEGQLAGGTAMGVGATLYEELRYDDEGQPLVTTFMDYLLPTLAEMPEVGITVFEHPALGNPLGARGAGEAGVIGVAAAIANALADAAGGAEGFTALPLGDERVLADLAAGRVAPA